MRVTQATPSLSESSSSAAFTPPPPSPANASFALDADVRVSILVGDRMCVGCGYNLTGQPVVRERHYQMLIVRCPECATVASTQEYPLLGRWANRWASLLLALWMLAIVMLWVGTGAAIFGFGVGSAELASDDFRSHLQAEFSRWSTSQQQIVAQAAATSPGAPPKTLGPAISSVDAWYSTQNRARLFRDAGGWLGISPWLLFVWFWMCVFALVMGCVWSVCLIGRSRGGLLLAGAIIMLAAAAFSTIPLAEWYGANTSYYYWGRAAERKIGGPVLIASIGLAWVVMSIGLVCGRSIARGVVTLLLPPRLRAPLALLWTVDGHLPPRAR